jgi:murein DD-endopeptidase MepM/ murein hydrolase activator NlpD
MSRGKYHVSREHHQKQVRRNKPKQRPKHDQHLSKDQRPKQDHPHNQKKRLNHVRSPSGRKVPSISNNSRKRNTLYRQSRIIAAAHTNYQEMQQTQDDQTDSELYHMGKYVADTAIHKAASNLKFKKSSAIKNANRNQSPSERSSLHHQKVETGNRSTRSSNKPTHKETQKRLVKKRYEKAARQTYFTQKRSTDVARQATQTLSSIRHKGQFFAKVGKAAVSHPILLAVILLIFLLTIVFWSLATSIIGLAGSGMEITLAASFLAEDAEITHAELAYTEFETDLQLEIANTETAYPYYDAYHYIIEEISHDPITLMAYLTVKYRSFTFGNVSGSLWDLFRRQYQLTYQVITETRYNDPYDLDEDEDREPYDWRTLQVNLTSNPLSDILWSQLNDTERQHYAAIRQTKGNRQYFASPVDYSWDGLIATPSGWRMHNQGKNLHYGVDLHLSQGTLIQAMQNGTVTFAGYERNFGNVVVLENESGMTSKYACLGEVLVGVGQLIDTGDAIGTTGSSGNPNEPYFHFEVLMNGQYVNPMFFVDSGVSRQGASVATAEPMNENTYGALIREAQRYIGYPYVWGGASPETSFDCSGYISFVLRNSGIKDVGRLTAQGLYQICTPVASFDARPGDLAFFTDTYSAAYPVTHVGIYVGNQMMLHCGNPIGYTRIDTAYWQAHFYGYGRITE